MKYLRYHYILICLSILVPFGVLAKPALPFPPKDFPFHKKPPLQVINENTNANEEVAEDTAVDEAAEEITDDANTEPDITENTSGLDDLNTETLTPEQRKKRRAMLKRKQAAQENATEVDDVVEPPNSSEELVNNQPQVPLEPSHEKIIEQRQDKLFAKPKLQPEVKEKLKENLETQKEWLTEKVAELQATTDAIEKAEIREEIKTYVQKQQAERRKIIEANLPAPKKDSLNTKTLLISEKFNIIIEQLAAGGVDTTELETMLADYTATAAEVQNLAAQLESSPNIDTLRALQAELHSLRETSQNLRNQVQSILTQRAN